MSEEEVLAVLIQDIKTIIGTCLEVELANIEVKQLGDVLESFCLTIPIEALKENARRLSANLKNAATTELTAENDWCMLEVETVSSPYLHHLIQDDSAKCFERTSTVVGEIIAFYLFLKSTCQHASLHSSIYMNFIIRALCILVNGSITYLVNTLPQFQNHEFEEERKQAISALEKRQFKMAFALIERHLFCITQEPLQIFDAYIEQKSRNKFADDKLCAARDIRAELYQLTAVSFYQRHKPIETVQCIVDIVISQTQNHLQLPINRVKGYYQKMVFKLFSHLDKVCSELLTEVTHYRSLISPTSGFERYTNKVTHLSGAAFAPSHHNKFQLFNNAANNGYGNDNGAFDQIMQAIELAERFVFILGWEFSPQLIFHRKNHPYTRTLGEILIDKARNNPHLIIAIMVWKQEVMYQNVGAQTHADALGYLQDLARKRYKTNLPENLIFTYALRQWQYLGVNSHHQKLVITDKKQWPFAQAFLGGLDLTVGRFDAKHQLRLIEDYMKVYHQTSDKTRLDQKALDARRLTDPDIGNLDKGNPYRTPWHDIHCKIEGAAVLDLLHHFYQHWAAHSANSKKNDQIKSSISDTVEQFKRPGKADKPEECLWTAQVLRSHTVHNCSFWKINSVYENSILQGYIEIISKAEKFIYIENQFFIGGGENVHNEERFGNLIPNAILKKIIEKHSKKEPFHVFITLPLFPEGGPESRIDNIVRRQQHNSMHWLINEINKYTDNNAHQYLSFFWFGEWNGKKENYDQLAKSKDATRKELIAASQRYPIYVHSKYINVDDKYVIVGSANINERSMMGIRDSEIAVLVLPEKGKEKECQLKLFEFRYALWHQYLGRDCLSALKLEGIRNPHTPEAVTCIQNHARYNLRCYLYNTSSRIITQGHCMAWPYLIKEQEELDEEFLAMMEKLPDTPLSEKNNILHNWMLDFDAFDTAQYSFSIDKLIGDHPDFK